ncbi:major facilitator superfamily domain-containing protein [Hypoxylon trugodes]|uniref:major facilitator superfamily domain-containing protein n=1 Tax=Hypoxylon trugodes TaxID=326681 RepID=UPI0021903642|nr:major facilitator superfamily domain-containing protein [Hypoxylon trugodes]KAI1385466.1 major facilitator superfamily domain-containing protein [Hypoxylon trugodes]
MPSETLDYHRDIVMEYPIDDDPTYLQELYTLRFKRPVITGIVVGLAYIGNVAGPLIGGGLTQYATWRWCFWINLPIGGIASAIILLTAITRHQTKHVGFLELLSLLDLLGFSLLASAVIMILLVMHYGGSAYQWNSSVVIGLFCGCGVTTIAFVFWERRRKEKAMMPLLLLANRVVWSSSLVAGFMTSALLVHSYYLPIYFQAVKNMSPILSGMNLLPSILSQLLSSVLSGIYVSKTGYCLPPIILSGILVPIGSGILSLLGPDAAAAKWIGYQILLGLGRRVGLQMPVNAVQAILDPDLLPVGVSLIVFAQTFAGSITLTVANAIFNSRLRANISHLAPQVSVDIIISAGATDFRSVVPDRYLTQVLEAYSQALSAVFYLSAALAVMYLAFSWGIGRTDVRKEIST